MKIILQRFIKYKFVVLSIAFALIATVDLANYGLPPTHDAEYHVLRFQQFFKVLSEGNLYPRWAPDFNNGFGVPLFNYVYPLPNYAAAIFHALGFGFIDAFKLNMVTASVVGSVFMYLWSKKYWGNLGGLVSSVFFTFSPYHLLDIYVRGSVGEVWSLGIAPALLWAYQSYFETKKKSFFILSVVLIALLILAHNILALIFFGFFILYSLFLIHNSREKKTQISSFFLICLLGLGLASPFWLPALLETKYVVGLETSNPLDHFPQIYKLIYSAWGYGMSGSNAPDQMSFQIGIANIIGVLCSIIIFLRTKNKSTFLFFLFILAGAVFLITPFSNFIWIAIPALSYIQFPWRLLSLVILISSFLAGSLVWDKMFKSKHKQTLAAVLIILVSVGLSIRYAKSPFYHKRADQHYLTRSNFTDGTNSPGDAFNTFWLKSVPEKENKKIEPDSGSAVVKINELKSTSFDITVHSNSSSKIQINTAYFPGWTAEINGERTEIEEKNGKMFLKIPKGANKVRVFLDNTPLQKFSYIYFLIAILVLALIKLPKERVRS